MHTITLKVNGDGIIDTGQKGRLMIGTQSEKASVELAFEIDETIEGAYQYVKFYHPKCTVLQRLTNKKVVLSQNIFLHPGVWLLSFFSSDAVITNKEAKGSYIFASVPIETYINNGILGFDIHSEEEEIIEKLEAEIDAYHEFENSIFGMSYNDLVIPEYITKIGDYFMYNSHVKMGNIVIGKNVRSIGSYAFYDMYINRLIFEENSTLETLADYAFSHLNPYISSRDIVIPKSVSSWGKYCFQGSLLNSLRFEDGSNIRSFTANSFYELHASTIYLPNKLTSFFAQNNGYILRKSNVKKLWIPKSITSNIPAQSIYQCDYLADIELEEGFDVSANFSNCSALTKESMVKMFESLRNRTGLASRTLTLGSTNLDKLTESDKAIATNKNWTLG